MEMGFFDFVKNLFAKKEQPPSSPSETEGQQTKVQTDEQFMTPQNPANSQGQTPSDQTPQK